MSTTKHTSDVATAPTLMPTQTPTSSTCDEGCYSHNTIIPSTQSESEGLTDSGSVGGMDYRIDVLVFA